MYQIRLSLHQLYHIQYINHHLLHCIMIAKKFENKNEHTSYMYHNIINMVVVAVVLERLLIHINHNIQISFDWIPCQVVESVVVVYGGCYG